MQRDHIIKTLIGAAAVTILTGTAARAQLVPCVTFDNSSSDAPGVVRDYLGRSKASFVRACGGGDHPQYLGADAVSKHGNVCRYSEYQLALERTPLPRLERLATPPQTYLLVTKSICPSPESTKYAAANSVPPDIFERLVDVWRAAVSSPKSVGRALSGISDPATLERLRNTVSHGRSDRLEVLRAVMERDFWLWSRYRLDVADPEHSDRFYAVTVTRWFGGTYGISHVGVGIY